MLRVRTTNKNYPDAVIVAKNVAKKFPNQLGFVNLASLEIGYKNKELETIGDFGFAHFHHRKNGQTTIYELAVSQEQQGQGWGRLLFYRVLCSAIEQNSSSIFLKCPVDNPSNNFYHKLGFTLEKVEPGNKRPLNCWRYTVEKPMLFYCADGGSSPYSVVAREEGWGLGVRSDAFLKDHVPFIDNNFKQYNHSSHAERIKVTKPMIATVQDIFDVGSLEEITTQAEEIVPYCGRVLLIPKCKFEPPTNFNYWWGYSVPTAYGGTSVTFDFFQGRPVHLLGGSPKMQSRIANHLNVVSLDGNVAMKLAAYGKSIWQTNGGVKVVSGNYESFRVSLREQKDWWGKKVRWRWEDEPLGKLMSNKLI